MRITIVYDTPIDFIPEDEESGLGGTEVSVVRYSRAFASLGHEVFVFNHNTRPGLYEGVQWCEIKDVLEFEGGDVTVYFKKVPEYFQVSAPLRAVVLMDRTIPSLLGDWLESGLINLIIPTSNWQYDCARAAVNTTEDMWFLSGLGTDMARYSENPKKTRGLCFYASVPYRGLEVLMDLWPSIKTEVPEASLELVSSYMVWGDSVAENESKSHLFYQKAKNLKPLDVRNLIQEEGELPRSFGVSEMVALQERAEILLYPSTYDDSFCLVALEAAAAGVVIITSERAALKERVIDGVTGYLIPGDPNSPEYQKLFIEKTVHLLRNEELRKKMARDARREARKYDQVLLAQQWVLHFNNKISNLEGLV